MKRYTAAVRSDREGVSKIRIYLHDGTEYRELTSGLISVSADLSPRTRRPGFIDGDRTSVYSSGITVRLRIMATDDTVSRLLTDTAEYGGSIAVKLTAPGIERVFTGTAMITKIYSSEFYGTEMTVEIRQ